VMGAVVTYFFTPETMGRSLEENENEEEPRPVFVQMSYRY
jgi:hypothetical protein